MITDEFFVVKEPKVVHRHLHFDKDTKRETTIKVGDKIEAQMSPDGHAKAIEIIIECKLKNGTLGWSLESQLSGQGAVRG